MDLDRFIARNEPTWRRLEELMRRRRLDAAEVGELVQLYQRTAAHLSQARTHLQEPALVARLTSAVAAANGLVYRPRAHPGRALGRFFTLTFPGAVHHCRRFMLAAALAFFVPALALGVWVSNDRAALDRSAPARLRHEYVQERFEQYYSTESPVAFFTHVTTNNIQVSFLVYAAGAVTGGLGAVAVLALNGAPLGIAGAWMATEGDLVRFLGFIVPHGALELTAIVIAGGAGMATGWAVIAPGDRLRATALREEGQRAITIVMGLTTMFLMAGTVEGFITGRGLPPAVRVTIGVLLWVVYLGYLVGQGRIAAARGITGLLGEQPRTWDDEPDRWAPAPARGIPAP